jgi:hypothetical protein
MVSTGMTDNEKLKFMDLEKQLKFARRKILDLRKEISDLNKQLEVEVKKYKVVYRKSTD